MRHNATPGQDEPRCRAPFTLCQQLQSELGRYCTRESVMRQPQLSSHCLPGKRHSLLLTIFFVVVPFSSSIFFSPSTLSRSPCFIWWKCVHSLLASYKEKSFSEAVTPLCRSQYVDFTHAVGSVHTWVYCLKEGVMFVPVPSLVSSPMKQFFFRLFKSTGALGIQLSQMLKYFFLPTYCLLMPLSSKGVVVFFF